MFKIKKIEDVEFYISKNINGMEEYATKRKEEINRRFKKVISFKKKDRDTILLDKRKDLELDKIDYLRTKFINDINKIIKNIPDLERIDNIYIELLKTYDIRKEDIKESLGRLKFIKNKIEEISENSIGKIKRTKNIKSIGFIFNKFLGRTTSLLKRNKKYFEKLDYFRKVANRLPVFLDLKTVAIAGVPNVGKSTLLKKITGSDVEIQNYPFTTKNLMFGYISQYDRRKIQLIDTPGLLERDKKNNIEERGNVIIKNKADLITFVFDLTESCGYQVKTQLKLLNRIKNITDKNIVIYLSKTDVYDDYCLERKEEIINNKLKKNYLIFEDYNKLKDYLLKLK